MERCNGVALGRVSIVGFVVIVLGAHRPLRGEPGYRAADRLGHPDRPARSRPDAENRGGSRPAGRQPTLGLLPDQGPRRQWIHSTIYKVPAHALVHVTVYQFDGDSGLRNPFLSQVQGTVGDTMEVDGKSMRSIPPEEASHTFAVPQLGLIVPLPGSARRSRKPVRRRALLAEQAHETITFTIRTGKPGRYRWQCFVPCAAGFLAGFGGPMQTIGYMDGFLEVVLR